MNEAFEQALQQIEDEKGISREEIISMIEAALASAFRKDYGEKNRSLLLNLIQKISPLKFTMLKP